MKLRENHTTHVEAGTRTRAPFFSFFLLFFGVVYFLLFAPRALTLYICCCVYKSEAINLLLLWDP